MAEFLRYASNLDLVCDRGRGPDAILSYLPAKAIRAWRLYRRHFRG